jgi:hypothetical protein
MIHRRKVLALLCAVAFSAVAAIAQEGHPLTGTWHGEWSPAPGQHARIVMFMKWDTKNIVGTINPGPKGGAITAATLDAEKWTVHFEGDTKDASGKLVHISADGKLDNIGSYNRTITGTWTQGGAKGDFKITRD